MRKLRSQFVGRNRRTLICVVILFTIWINLGILIYNSREDENTSYDSLIDLKDEILNQENNHENYYKRDNYKSNPHDYKYTINEPYLCKNSTEPPYILVQVHSRPNGQDRRDAIRKTWGSVEALKEMKRTALIVFLVGFGPVDVNKDLKVESSKHHDIIQENFHDSYDNLPIKSIMGMKWATTFCPEATFTLKTDDDMFMSIPALEEILENVNTTRLLGGALNRAAKVMRGGIWKVKEEQFPFEYFPVYCAGAAYVVTLDVAKILYETSEYKTKFYIEDAYVTGVLAKMAGIEPLGLPGFPFWITRLRNETLCEVKQRKLIGIHALPPPMMKQTWTKFQSNDIPGCKLV